MKHLLVPFLTAATMMAFAANSLLCRLALREGKIDPSSFTAIRIIGGALALFVLDRLFSRNKSPQSGGSWASAAALVGYAAFFSFAYVRIDSGIGALALFMLVQVTMLGWNMAQGKRLSAFQWTGLLVAITGLAILTVPGKLAPDPLGLALMSVAGVCWGIYSLRGKKAVAPISATAANFARGSLLVALISAVSIGNAVLTGEGVALALASGIVTSGLGYSLWYTVLPRISTVTAAVAQLTVPAIASLGGVALLGEQWSLQTIFSGILILAGVLIASFPRSAQGT